MGEVSNIDWKISQFCSGYSVFSLQFLEQSKKKMGLQLPDLPKIKHQGSNAFLDLEKFLLTTQTLVL